MTDTAVTARRNALKTPKSAAIAGIIFAVLYGASMILINISLPNEPVAGFAWLETDVRTITLALNLIPYAGIAFLWFIGVIRDLLSEMEDRLFSTVFLGSGLLFLALTFIGAALAGGLLSSLCDRIECPDKKWRIDLQPECITSHLQHLCHPHGGCVHDIAGQYLVSHPPDAPRLGLPDIRSGSGVAAEYRLYHVGDPDLPGMGAGGQSVYPGPEPAQTASGRCT